MAKRLLILLVLIVGCPPVASESRTAAEGPLAGRVPGPPRRCVNLLPNEHLIGLDDTTLAYRDGLTLWVTRPQGPCSGLDGVNTIIVEQTGSQTCRGDHVRVIQHPLTTPGPICTLGDFVPYRKP